MKNRLISCVLACLMIFLVGCNGNTAKEAAQEITKTETSFPAGNTETNSQEETAAEPESTAVQEDTPITAEENQSTAESQTVATVQTKPAEEKPVDTPVTEKPKAEPTKADNHAGLNPRNKRSSQKNRQLPNKSRLKNRRRSRQNQNRPSRLSRHSMSALM